MAKHFFDSILFNLPELVFRNPYSAGLVLAFMWTQPYPAA